MQKKIQLNLYMNVDRIVVRKMEGNVFFSSSQCASMDHFLTLFFIPSVHAWQIADQLLRLNKDENTSYFGAQTMKTKVYIFIL